MRWIEISSGPAQCASAYFLVGALSLLTLSGTAQAQNAAVNLPAESAQTEAIGTAPVIAGEVITAPRSSNKWRIKFDESSKSDGVITFRVWTTPTTTVDVPVNVARRQTENAIARATRDAFRTALGKGYKVETDDGEDVLVKAKGKTPRFSLALVSSTADDVDIRLHRE